MMFSSSSVANARDRLPSNITWNTIRLVNSMMRKTVFFLFQAQGDMLISDGIVSLISLFSEFRNGVHDEFIESMRNEYMDNGIVDSEFDVLVSISEGIIEATCSTLLEFLSPFMDFSKEKAHVWLCLLLDPRFKRLKVLRDLERSFPGEFPVRALNERYEKILFECLVRARQFLHPTGTDLTDSELSNIADIDDFDKYRDCHFMSSDSYAFVTGEFVRYRELPLIESSENALEWWAKNSHLFPTLAVVSRLIFGIPCSQCECERTFSIAGLLSQNRRNNISVENMDHVIRINKNLTNFENFQCHQISDFEAFVMREAELLEDPDTQLDNVDDVEDSE